MASVATGRSGPLRRLAAVLGLVMAWAGCATSTAMREGLRAEERQDYDQAVTVYAKEVHTHPNNVDARTALERSRLRAAQDHFSRGRRLAAMGKYEDALSEYELAGELNPSSAEIEQALGDVRTKIRARVAVTRDGKTDLETLIEHARDQPAAGPGLPQNIRMPASLVFRDTSSRDVFAAIARFADISLAFDSTFRASPMTIDLRNASLEDALNRTASATRTFIRVTAARTVAVVPDTPAKHREYDEQILRTFYLSNADLKETTDLLRLVIEAQHIAPSAAINAITIRDTPDHLAAAARVIAAIDKARPEVTIDVELLEVDRTKLLEYGLQIASPGSPGINGQASIVPSQTSTTTTGTTGVSLQSLVAGGASQVLLSSLPGLYYRLLKSDANTRTLANPQLRTSDGTPAQAKFGDRVPVPVTTFSPLATGGTPQQPITSYNYENIGVNIDITPRIHHDDDVTLALKVEVSAIEATSGFGGLPEFSNRQINTVINLRDGETSLLAGLITEDETKLIEGIPGLSGIPGIGRLFAHTQKQTTQTDIMLSLTPHIVHVLDLTESDLRPFQIRNDSASPVAGPPARAEPPNGLAGNLTQPSSTPADLDLTGTWLGTLTTLPGAPQMIWTLTEAGTSVDGSVVVSLQGLVLLNGTLAGTLTNATTLSDTITVPEGGLPTAPTCSGQLTGSAALTPLALNGAASPGAISCVSPISTVTFTLTKQ
jgi:general secretion pathway protein D